MKIFISYLSEEKILAGRVKKELDEAGFDAFLAHVDIKATQLWMDSIYENLGLSKIFLPLLTEGINESYWCNQEIGVAFAKNILIVPIKIDINPVGFLSKYQALKFHRESTFPIDKLYDIISRNEKLGSSFRDFKINVLGNSESFFDAEKNANIIVSMDGYSKKQLELIMKHSIENDQIYKGVIARRILKEFMRKHKRTLNQMLYSEFNNRL